MDEPTPISVALESLRARITVQAEDQASKTGMPKATSDSSLLETRLREAGVPKRFRAILAVDLRPTDGLRAARDYTADLDGHVADGQGLILRGPVGVGKTVAALHIVGECAQRSVPAWFARCSSLLDDISASGRFSQGSKFDELRLRLEKAVVLVLDDFGQERGDSWAERQLETIIARRYDDQLPVVVTTNLTGEEMAGKYSERILDRLQHTCRIVTLKGQSFREASNL